MRLMIILLSGIIVFSGAVCLAEGAVSEDIQKPTVIIVVGAGGTPEYTAQFGKSALQLELACSEADVEPIVIGLDTVTDSNDRDILEERLNDESKDIEVALWLVLIGHGTFDGRTAKFNLRGPDISADEMAEWLKPFSRPIAVINAYSSSAPFLAELSGPDRVVITATKSGFELNYARFGQYFAEAIAEPQADIDKDGQTSLLEAFLTASNNVAEFYSTAGRLATEHALLDDNGDGLGTPADWFQGIRPVQQSADNTPLDGFRAHQFYLVRSEFENQMPIQLRAKRDQLELEVIELREAKDSYTEEEYFSRLEQLLYEMAKIYEQAGNTADN